ncbi:MAG: LL-diaminopimelate aminotransferase [Candidatus Omnitrophica bacterium]|nr:LL-diaminopimelate aminotransferase [Candidatus Omnitrophota bacterium]
MHESSERLQKLPPYLFIEIDRLKREARSKGHDIIDLGVGDPDLNTPEFIIDELNRQARIQINQRYALDQGIPELRQEIARWLKMRFNIEMDSATEILPTIGSKEAIAHFPLAIINEGDLALIPDPCYPPYKSGVLFAGGEFELMPLRAENSFLPDLSKLSEGSLTRAKLLYLNYPNNPTSACATKGFYEDAVRIAKKYNIIICSDLAYSEMTFDGFTPLSIMQINGAKDSAIEFHSLSKTYNMTGWRIGFAYGNKELIRLLSKVKANIDSGVFQAIQYAGIRALREGAATVEKNLAIYKQRRDILVEGLQSLGYELQVPQATFYLWIKVPRPYTSADFCMKLLREAHIVVTPGNGFGPSGEGYFRIALTIDSKRLPQVIERMRKIKL